MGDERSPWERDDWMPAPVEPESDPVAAVGPVPSRPADSGDPAPPPEARAGQSGPVRAERRSGGLRVVVTTVAVVAALAAFLALRDDDHPGEDRVAVTDTTASSVAAPTRSAPTASTPTSASVPTVPTSEPPPTQPPVDVTVRVPTLVEVEIGRVPTWTKWAFDVPPALAAATTANAPAEIVVVDAEAVHRVDLATGNVRSVALTERWDPGADVAVLGDTIAISSYRSVVLLHDDRPVASIPFGQGVESIVARPARDDLLVTLRSSSRTGGRQQWSLAPEGHIVDLTEARPAGFPTSGPSVLPTGDIGVNAPGGVYAIGDDGTVERISSGMLIAVGRHHYVVEECDEALRCGLVLVDTRDGLRSVAAPGAVDLAGAPVLSPDGSTAVSVRWESSPGSLVLTDLATGTVREVATVLSFHGRDTWLDDGSAVVLVDAGVLRFHGPAGWTASIGGFGPGIRAAT